VYLLIPDQHLLWLLIALVLVAKFSVNVACFCVYLQCMELYPTNLRQTGTSLGVLVSTLFGSFSPYIAYLVITLWQVSADRNSHMNISHRTISPGGTDRMCMCNCALQLMTDNSIHVLVLQGIILCTFLCRQLVIQFNST